MAAVYTAVIFWMDPLFVTILSHYGLRFLALPAAAIAVIFLLFAAGTRRPCRPPLILLLWILIISSLVAAAPPANLVIQERAVANAKAYPARVAPLLEAYRQTHGAYPTSLSQLPSKPFVPRLLRRSYGYHSDGTSYSFRFPISIMDSWEYDSKTQKWHAST